MGQFKLSKTSLGRLEGVDEELVAVVKRAITITPIDLASHLWAAYAQSKSSASWWKAERQRQ